MNEILLMLARHGLVKMIVGKDGTTLEYRRDDGKVFPVEAGSPHEALASLSMARFPDADPDWHDVPDDRAEAVRLLSGSLVERIDSITRTEKLDDRLKYEALLTVRAALNGAIEFLTE